MQLKALAQQTALRSAESLAGDDLIGLNVIARETRALEPVGGVQFLDVAREPVTGKSDDSLPVKVEVPVALPDGELAGSVVAGAGVQGPGQQPVQRGGQLGPVPGRGAGPAERARGGTDPRRTGRQSPLPDRAGTAGSSR